MPQSVEELLTELYSRGLITQQQRAAAREEAAKQPAAQHDETLRRLVDQSVLTEYQAEAVRLGRLDDLVLDKCVILNPLGAGGMGQVFRARHLMMARTVAIKLMHSHVVNSRFIQRFEREIQTAAQLQHPNVVVAYDAGESRGRRFLVMEYIPGVNLLSLVRDQGPLDRLQALDFLRQAAEGLHYVHQQGVIHRDVKPANLMRTEQGIVKVLDVGLARLAPDRMAMLEAADLTLGGQTLGTVAFMSPEQAQDSRAVDPRSDIYSLGCTLYYLLSGKLIYAADSVGAMIVAHRERPVPVLRDVCPAASEALEEAFQRMVAKRAEDRYDSMAEVLDPLNRILGAFAGTNSNDPPQDLSAGLGNVETLVTGLDERDCLRKFLDEPAAHRCLRPRFFAGIACPWDAPLPSHDFYQLLQPVCEELDGQLDMKLCRETLSNMLSSNARFDVVVLVAHGEWRSESFSLRLLRDNDPMRLSASFSLDRMGKVLQHVGAKLAIVTCCQDYEPVRLADLGDHLIQAAPSLCGAITFRTKLPFDTAHKFLGTMCRALIEDAPFQLDRAVDQARLSLPATLPDNDVQRLDFAIAAVHVRRIVELHRAPAAGFIDLDRNAIPPVSFSPSLAGRFREMVRAAPNAPQDLENVEMRFRTLRVAPADAPVAIARYPVTCSEYREFLRGGGAQMMRDRKPADWSDLESLPSEKEWLPVTGIRLRDALAYIKWLNDKPKGQYEFRLPLLLEWIAIAYWGQPHMFPWGGQWRPWNESQQANAETSQLVPVYEPWCNEIGVYGMMGNCWELLLHRDQEQNLVRVIGGGFRSAHWQCTAFAYRDLPHLTDADRLCVDGLAAAGGGAPNAWDVGFRLVAKRRKP